MICLTRLQGSVIYINPDQIQSIEETPDTHVTLMNGNRFIVVESARMIADRIISYKATILRRAGHIPPLKYLGKRHVAAYRPRWEESSSESDVFTP